MQQCSITCPHCGFSRQVPTEKVPAGAVRVTCPQCRQQFDFSLAAAQPAPAGAGPATAAVPTPAPVAAASTPPPPPPPERRRALSGIEELFKQTWELYKRRWGTLLGIYFILIIVVLLVVGLFAGLGWLASLGAGGEVEPFVIGGVLCGTLVAMVLGAWVYGAFVCASADESLGVGAALRRGGELFWAFFWAYSLVGYIVLGGYVLFIIPGVIFLILLSPVKFIIALERERGVDALLKAREYMQGQALDVFVRLFIVWIVGALLGSVPFIGSLFSIAFMPFSALYTYLVYRELREMRGDQPPTLARRAYWQWIGISSVGHVLLFALLIFVAVKVATCGSPTP